MPKKVQLPATRKPRLPHGAPLDYAPDNEQGVVFLFSAIARSKYGLSVERVQGGFPDCVAYQGGKRIRIEFEFQSRNFELHGHDANKCDWIVCWSHNWPGVPNRLRVVELRREFGLGFNVWFQPVGADYKDTLASIDSSNRWSVPSLASEGDLILFHRTSPDSYVQDVFRLAKPVRHVTAGWKVGKDWMGEIKRVCRLKTPLHFAELKAHKVLASAGFVRGQMRGRFRATAHWPDLYAMITERNPSIIKVLKKYGPARID